MSKKRIDELTEDHRLLIASLDKKHQRMLQETISKAAQEMADKIDDDLYKAYIKKKKMDSGKAICLNDCIFENCSIISPNLIQFDEGRLYKYEVWEYYSNGRMEVRVWDAKNELVSVTTEQYMAGMKKDDFRKNFRPFI